MAFHTTSGRDVVDGTSGRDVIGGLGGNDVLRGHGGDDELYGNAGNDRLFGGAGHDTLYGGHGADILIGGYGLDALFGGYGNDVLIGGAWGDAMIGGAGADVFKFVASDVSRQNDWGDSIQDFSQAEGDRLNMAAMPRVGGTGQQLTFIGTDAFSGHGGEVRYVIVGGVTIVEVDIQGYSNPNYGGNGDYQLEMAGAITLTASDFIF